MGMIEAGRKDRTANARTDGAFSAMSNLAVRDAPQPGSGKTISPRKVIRSSSQG